MNDTPIPILLCVLIISLLLSAFFSGSETALMTLNRYRLRHQATQGRRGAIHALQLLERPDRLIGLVLLGNNFVNITASSIATIIALKLGGESALAIATGSLTLIMLVFSEVAPKTLGALYPERIAYPAAAVYIPLLKLLQPVVWFVNVLANGLLRLFGVTVHTQDSATLSREELRTIVNETAAVIPERSRAMLVAILDLEHATVEDIMIPRHEVEGIDLQDSEEDIIKAIRYANYTHLPLFDGGIDNVIGIIHIRHALAILLERGSIKTQLRTVASTPYFVPEGTRLYQQLLQLQRAKRRVALVVDEYGDCQGMITLQDLLEEIVGEFTTDPADAFSTIYRADDGTLLIEASMGIRELNRALCWNLPTAGPKTLNGLILEYMETIPEPGTSLKLYGYPLEIVQSDDKAVKTVKAHAIKTP